MSNSHHPTPAEDLASRVRAALAGAFAGEQAAANSTGAGQLLAVAESLALRDGLDLEDLRSRGLSAPPVGKPSAGMLRGLPFGLLAPLDRPLIRRGAYRVVRLGGADEGLAIAAVAVAVLAADLTRFDLATSLMRVHQTLLEEAPSALLRRLRVPDDASAPATDDDPLDALELAIGALARGVGVRTVVDDLNGRRPGLTVALSLAGVLAGARDRERGLHDDWREQLPNAGRLATASSGLSRRACARLEAALTRPAAGGGADTA